MAIGSTRANSVIAWPRLRGRERLRGRGADGAEAHLSFFMTGRRQRNGFIGRVTHPYV